MLLYIVVATIAKRLRVVASTRESVRCKKCATNGGIQCFPPSGCLGGSDCGHESQDDVLLRVPMTRGVTQSQRSASYPCQLLPVRHYKRFDTNERQHSTMMMSTTVEPPAPPPNELRHRRRRSAQDATTPSGEDATETAVVADDGNLTGLDAHCAAAEAMGTATPIPTRRKLTSVSVNEHHHHQATMLTAKQVRKEETKPRKILSRVVFGLCMFSVFSGLVRFQHCKVT
jgi:hypothetical protein